MNLYRHFADRERATAFPTPRLFFHPLPSAHPSVSRPLPSTRDSLARVHASAYARATPPLRSRRPSRSLSPSSSPEAPVVVRSVEAGSPIALSSTPTEGVPLHLRSPSSWFPWFVEVLFFIPDLWIALICIAFPWFVEVLFFIPDLWIALICIAKGQIIDEYHG